jgi:hypothetical protein
MKEALKALMRLVLMMIWIAFGFCWGFVAGAKYCEWWVVPRWAKEYPHDGQLGLGVLGYAVVGGLLCATIALFVGIMLVERFRQPRKNQD